MKSKLGSLALSVLPLIFVALVSAVPARAQGAPAQSPQSNLTVTYPTGFAVSPPVSQISQPALPTVQTIIPLRPRPLAKWRRARAQRAGPGAANRTRRGA